METLRVVRARGCSTFIGIEAAIGLEYETRNDETTCCNFCPNRCSRTFIDTRLPDGGTARYIAGFSCEKGTVENKEALKTLAARRKTLRNQYPNLVEQEAARAFKHFFKPAPMPEAGTPTRDVEVHRSWFGRVKRRLVTRRFQRSSAVAARRREKLHTSAYPGSSISIASALCSEDTLRALAFLLTTWCGVIPPQRRCSQKVVSTGLWIRVIPASVFKPISTTCFFTST